MNLLVWVGIILCLSQSAMLSGLNLAFFSLSKLSLEIEAGKGNRKAVRVLAMREDSNFILTTILWSNVAANVLLALLSGSVLAGMSAFLFSTVVITLAGEILPQAYFSRHALKTSSFFIPVLKTYQILLFVLAKPTAMVLDKWLGKEGIQFFKEQDFRELINMHMKEGMTDIHRMEGTGALNFLELDDMDISEEGEALNPKSIICIGFTVEKPVFPDISRTTSDVFLNQVKESGKKWVILTDEDGEPRIALDADQFIRNALFTDEEFLPMSHCHRPIVIRDDNATLGEIIPRFKVDPLHGEDDVIDEDIILIWGKDKKIITGSDILGRLLRGIVRNKGMKGGP
ncbi:MAG: DUF21 domain-containing protein [Clostridia bacterium]